MLPENQMETIGENEKTTDKTQKIDFDNMVIGEDIDSVEALKQAVKIALMTERYKYPIFPHSYGTDYKNALEEGYMKAMGKVKNAVYESLMCDDRITNVKNFDFEKRGNRMIVCFTIETVFGNMRYETEVK